MTDKKIMSKYKFFHPEKPLTESLMQLGFNCESGWFNLIIKMCDKLKDIAPNDFEILQVKQKFGMLTIYHNKYNDKIINDIINTACYDSLTICEKCGNEGIKRHLTYIQTLCNNCYTNELNN